jgi:hypothetical protein
MPAGDTVAANLEIMNRDQVAALVNSAITRVIAAERELLDRNVSERTLADHLARFIREAVPLPYAVDVEYNRHIDDPKRLQLPRENALDDEVRATIAVPDIVVHVRGTDDHNLLALEVKKPGRNRAKDERKLRAFSEQLKYHHAAHVILGRNHDDEIIHEVIWVD